jgi:hypothetical protein
VEHRILVPLTGHELRLLLERRNALLEADEREAVREGVAEAEPRTATWCACRVRRHQLRERFT